MGEEGDFFYFSVKSDQLYIPLGVLRTNSRPSTRWIGTDI